MAIASTHNSEFLSHFQAKETRRRTGKHWTSRLIQILREQLAQASGPTLGNEAFTYAYRTRSVPTL